MSRETVASMAVACPREDRMKALDNKVRYTMFHLSRAVIRKGKTRSRPLDVTRT